MFVRNFYPSEISHNGIKNIIKPSKVTITPPDLPNITMTTHTFGPKDMQVLYLQKKGTHLNTMKIFYIYK